MLVADHVCGFMAEATKEDEHLVQPMDIEGIEKRAFLIPHTDKAEGCRLQFTLLRCLELLIRTRT